MKEMTNYTNQLAGFCSALEYRAIPGQVVEKAKWVILDSLGIILGGTKFDVGKTIAKYAQTLGDKREASVLGFGFKSSARNAAFVNGSLSEILEMQDGYTKGAIHPSDGTISASLAVAEWRQRSGKDLITAVIVGYEAANRISEAIHPSHFVRGFLPTATVGTMGAAVAAARLLKVKEDQMCNALGIAGFMVPVANWDNLFYSIKQAQGGLAAKTGVESALLAKQGLTAAPVEGDPKIQRGFCKMMSDEHPKFERMVEGLGDHYTIKEVYFKPYASCRLNHGPIQLALELKAKYGLNVDEIEEILVKTYDIPVQRTGSIKTDTNSPFAVCQFSMSYAVAGALLDGQAGLKQLTPRRIKDSKIHHIGSKLRVVADPELQKFYPGNRPYIMEITMKDGRKLSGRVDYPKGDHRNPMAEEEMKSKFLSLAQGVLEKKKAKRAMDLILDLEHLDSVANFVRYLK
jgi:2-methylcitrate dehydratase PrpD